MTYTPPCTNSHIMSPEIIMTDGSDVPDKAIVIWNYEREGDVIFWSVHEAAMEKMQQRITYLENCCDECVKQLTGD